MSQRLPETMRLLTPEQLEAIRQDAQHESVVHPDSVFELLGHIEAMRTESAALAVYKREAIDEQARLRADKERLIAALGKCIAGSKGRSAKIREVTTDRDQCQKRLLAYASRTAALEKEVMDVRAESERLRVDRQAWVEPHTKRIAELEAQAKDRMTWVELHTQHIAELENDLSIGVVLDRNRVNNIAELETQLADERQMRRVDDERVEQFIQKLEAKEEQLAAVKAQRDELVSRIQIAVATMPSARVAVLQRAIAQALSKETP